MSFLTSALCTGYHWNCVLMCSFYYFQNHRGCWICYFIFFLSDSDVWLLAFWNEKGSELRTRNAYCWITAIEQKFHLLLKFNIISIHKLQQAMMPISCQAAKLPQGPSLKSALGGSDVGCTVSTLDSRQQQHCLPQQNPRHFSHSHPCTSQWQPFGRRNAPLPLPPQHGLKWGCGRRTWQPPLAVVAWGKVDLLPQHRPGWSTACLGL